VCSSDLDGKVDLILTTASIWPEPKQTLQVFKNVLPEGGHWVGFHFQEDGRGKSAVGVRVKITYGGRSAVRQVVTGDSHRSQHPDVVHFGIGEVKEVETAEITWPIGRTVTLKSPTVDQYHQVAAPVQ